MKYMEDEAKPRGRRRLKAERRKMKGIDLYRMLKGAEHSSFPQGAQSGSDYGEYADYSYFDEELQKNGTSG